MDFHVGIPLGHVGAALAPEGGGWGRCERLQLMAEGIPLAHGLLQVLLQYSHPRVQRSLFTDAVGDVSLSKGLPFVLRALSLRIGVLAMHDQSMAADGNLFEGVMHVEQICG